MTIADCARRRIEELSDALLEAIAEEPMPGLLRERCRKVVQDHLGGPLLHYVEESRERPLAEVLKCLVLLYDPSQRQVGVGLKS